MIARPSLTDCFVLHSAPNLPGVYARVSWFKDWIEGFTNDKDFDLATTKAPHKLMKPTAL